MPAQEDNSIKPEELWRKILLPLLTKRLGPVKRTADGLPVYSRGEELANTVSHGAGVLIGIGMLIYSLLWSHSVFGVIGGIVYGVSLVILYLASSVYHGMPGKDVPRKKLFRLFDHCSIFILVAGTCTPFILELIARRADPSEWGFYAVIWLLALVGIALLCVSLKKFAPLAMVLYVLMGVLLVARSSVFAPLIGEGGPALLLAGGGVYLVGLVFYGLGARMKWMHTVFHVFCLLGSGLHCACVAAYVI